MRELVPLRYAHGDPSLLPLRVGRLGSLAAGPRGARRSFPSRAGRWSLPGRVSRSGGRHAGAAPLFSKEGSRRNVCSPGGNGGLARRNGSSSREVLLRSPTPVAEPVFSPFAAGSASRRLGSGRSAALASRSAPAGNDSYLVDPASSHMLVSKIKPCMSKYERFEYSETANGSLHQ